jgi:hypothetical protein
MNANVVTSKGTNQGRGKRQCVSKRAQSGCWSQLRRSALADTARFLNAAWVRRPW